MIAKSKSGKKATSQLVREPVTGRAARSGPGYSFTVELVSFTVNGVQLDPAQAADELAGIIVWAINNGGGNANPNP